MCTIGFAIDTNIWTANFPSAQAGSFHAYTAARRKGCSEGISGVEHYTTGVLPKISGSRNKTYIYGGLPIPVSKNQEATGPFL